MERKIVNELYSPVGDLGHFQLTLTDDDVWKICGRFPSEKQMGNILKVLSDKLNNYHWDIIKIVVEEMGVPKI
jgi:hypothetical protein